MPSLWDWQSESCDGMNSREGTYSKDLHSRGHLERTAPQAAALKKGGGEAAKLERTKKRDCADRLRA